MLHLAVVVGVVDLLLQLSGVAAADPWMRAVLGGAVGALLGPLVVAVYLWIADHFRVNSNELYAGLRQRGVQELPAPPRRPHRVDRLPDRRPAPDRLDVRPRTHAQQAPGDPTERGDWAGRPWFRPKTAIQPELIENPIHIPPRHRCARALRTLIPDDA